MLDFDFIEWDDANERHIGAADLTPDVVEDVLRSPDPVKGVSNTYPRLTADGPTHSGRYIQVVYEATKSGGVTVLRPITAYDVDPP